MESELNYLCLQSKINYVKYQGKVRLVRSRRIHRTMRIKGSRRLYRVTRCILKHLDFREPRRGKSSAGAKQLKEKLREHRISVTIHYGSRSERKWWILKSARRQRVTPISGGFLNYRNGMCDEEREYSGADSRQ